MPRHLETKILVAGVLCVGVLVTQMNRSMACRDPDAERMVIAALRGSLRAPAEALRLTQVRSVSDGWFDQKHECTAEVRLRPGIDPALSDGVVAVAYETMVAITGENLVSTHIRDR